MREWIIEKLGGFPSVEDAIEEIKSREDKSVILTLAVKHLFNTISQDDILKEKEGQWFFMGRAVSDGEKKLLISEARTFLEMKLWDVIQKDISFQANRKMYLLAENELDIIAGKLWTYCLDCIRTRLKSISEESGIFNKTV